MKKIGFLIILNIVVFSCASEGYSSSPLSNAFTTEAAVHVDQESLFSNFIIENINASELSKLISTFPSFKKDNLDKEITYMKANLQTYLFAIESGNRVAKDKSLTNFEKRYKKIQNLKKTLSPDQEDLLNSYLVRVKTNISEIEAIVNQ